MSKGKRKSTKRKLLLSLIVVLFLSTFILAMVSYIFIGEISIVSAIVDLLTKALKFTVTLVALYQTNYL